MTRLIANIVLSLQLPENAGALERGASISRSPVMLRQSRPPQTAGHLKPTYHQTASQMHPKAPAEKREAKGTTAKKRPWWAEPKTPGPRYASVKFSFFSLSSAQPRPPQAPRIRLASWISFCMMVTRLAWMAQRLVSSNRWTRKASAASCSAWMACDCQRRASPSGTRLSAISRT